MKFRIANSYDYKTLAQLHFICGQQQVDGFMHKLGVVFLEQYYKVTLREKHIVILIAEDKEGNAKGFISGTLDASEHSENLNRHRLSLAISTIPAIIKCPKLIKELMHRKSALSNNSSDKKFVVVHGARGEYWAWLPEDKSTMISGVLRQAWLNILAELGCRKVRYELDLGNSSFEKFEKFFGCTLIEEITLPDGRKRVIVEQKLNRRPGKA